VCIGNSDRGGRLKGGGMSRRISELSFVECLVNGQHFWAKRGQEANRVMGKTIAGKRWNNGQLAQKCFTVLVFKTEEDRRAVGLGGEVNPKAFNGKK